MKAFMKPYNTFRQKKKKKKKKNDQALCWIFNVCLTNLWILKVVEVVLCQKHGQIMW